MATSMTARNWIGYLCESLVASGAMPTWEAAAYLTDNLFGEAPNLRLHETKAPYEAASQFFQRVYSPLVEAAERAVDLPASSMIHIFTDISRQLGSPGGLFPRRKQAASIALVGRRAGLEPRVRRCRRFQCLGGRALPVDQGGARSRGGQDPAGRAAGSHHIVLSAEPRGLSWQ